MAKQLQIQSKESLQGFLLDEIKPGFNGTIVAMVSRKWDVINVSGKYMSTDFILSDEKANLIHCFVNHNRSYKFLEKLQEGSLFSFKEFKVHSNRDTFRIFKDGLYMLEFDGNTKIAKATGDVSRYIRYPFQFLELEEVAPTNNLYVVDLIGYVTSVGEMLTKSTGAKTLEFNFTNQRGRQVRVTLWGKLGNNMIKKKLANPGVYALILTAMSAKKYIGQLGVSSSSSTQIIDNDDIPALKQFKAALSGRDLSQTSVSNVQTIPQVNTLAELLDWGRMKKSDPDDNEDGTVVFSNLVEIVGVRTSSGWYLITCNSGRCRKGLTRDDGGFKCEGCNKTVLYPRFRFKLQLDIRDETATVVAVLFDDPAETLLNRTAKSLMEEEMRDETEDDVLPPALQQLIGSKYIFEIKGHTYYCAGTYEAFNCTQIILPGPNPLLLGADSSQHTTSKSNMESSSSKVKDSVGVVTPLKIREPKKRKPHANESVPAPSTAGKNKRVLNLGSADNKSSPATANEKKSNETAALLVDDVFEEPIPSPRNEGNLNESDTNLVGDVLEEPKRSPRMSKRGRVVYDSESDGDKDAENNSGDNDEEADNNNEDA